MSRPTRIAILGTALALVGASVLPGGASAVGRTAAPSAGAAAIQTVVSDPGTDAAAPALSFSGRYIAYVATRRDQTSPRQQIRRADLSAGGSELLNPSIDGGVAFGNNSRPPVISADGSRVAFTSTGARLVAADTNGRPDAFVRDASTNTTLLTSTASDGTVSTGRSGMTSLSKSGRYAVFTSTGTDVVSGSTTTNADVYRRDLATNTTVQVTVRPDGAPSRGPGSTSTDVSADGNLVAFSSYNSDLATADGVDQETDLFVRTMSTGQTRWLSAGLPLGANPSGVVISPDGRWVSSRWEDGSLHLTRVDSGSTSTVTADGYALLGAFSSQLGRFVYLSGGTPHVLDLATGRATTIATPGGGAVTTVTISGNGRFAAFDWVPADGGPSVIVRVAL